MRGSELADGCVLEIDRVGAAERKHGAAMAIAMQRLDDRVDRGIATGAVLEIKHGIGIARCKARHRVRLGARADDDPERIGLVGDARIGHAVQRHLAVPAGESQLVGAAIDGDGIGSLATADGRIRAVQCHIVIIARKRDRVGARASRHCGGATIGIGDRVRAATDFDDIGIAACRHAVIAIAERDRFGSLTARDLVVSISSGDGVPVATDGDAIGAIAKRDCRIALPGIDAVIAAAEADRVEIAAGRDRVIAIAERHRGIAGSAGDAVIAIASTRAAAAGYRVVIALQVHHHVAAAGIDRRIALAGIDDIIAAIVIDRVVIARGVDDIGASRALDRRGSVRSAGDRRRGIGDGDSSLCRWRYRHIRR